MMLVKQNQSLKAGQFHVAVSLASACQGIYKLLGRPQ
jgi:hypothetical protein